MSQTTLRATLKILKGSTAGECYTLSADKTVLGRESECEIVLPRTTISRRHAQIVFDGEGYYIEDLDSLNGTFVDSMRIVEPTRLRGGEHIQIDEFLMSFRQPGASLEDSECEIKAEPSIERQRPDVDQTIRSTYVGQFAVLSGAGLRCEVDPQAKLDAMMDIVRNVGTSLNIDQVLGRVLDTLFQIFPQADRGYVFLTDGDELSAIPCAAKRRICEDDPSTTIGVRSNALAADALEKRAPLLYTIPGEGPGDAEMALGDSARAIMAAPLVTPTQEPVGVIQLETEDAGRQFINHDLELLAGVGSLAGQFVEHARLIERDRAKAALAREHAATDRERRRLREVLDILPVGVFISDEHGKLLEANPEARSIWGGDAPLCDKPADYAACYRIRRPGSDRPLASEEFPLARAISRGEICRGEEFEIEAFDGQRRTILGYARPIQDGERLVGGVVVNVDVTGLKRAEQALTQANQRKDEFLAMLGHELRNPLAPLVSALAMMAKKDVDDDTIDWARRLMERQVDHMVRLVDDLLDVSRIERGKFTLHRGRINLADVIGSAVEASQPLIDAHGHKLEVSLPAEPVILYADPVRLAQVVTNLLNNAAKYMEPGGRIWLTAQRQNGHLIITVRDTGIGIAADLLPRVFEPFTQAKQSLDRSQGGLGIGLGLVRKIVELHGGLVSAESDGPGKGSLFTVRIPIVDPSTHFETAPSSNEERSNPRRVLVVDDQVAQAQVLAKLFTKLWGHDVDIAYDGPSAWQSMIDRNPDVVLMDIGLPGINGYDLARQIRGEPQFSDTLLVALTGYGQEEDHRRSREAGFDLHLVKPPSVSTLRDIFSHPKLNRSS